MESSADKGVKKRIFSVVKIESAVEAVRNQLPVYKISLGDEQAAEFVKRASAVNHDPRDKVLTQIKFEDEGRRPQSPKRRPTPLQALRRSRSINAAAAAARGATDPNNRGVVTRPETAKGPDPEDDSVYPHQTTMYTKRLMEKNGSSNVLTRSSRGFRYLSDFYTTLSDLKWRYCLLILILVNVFTWLLFAAAYYALITIHSDVANRDDSSWKFCITNVHSFVTCFLFSVETQHTIGYGFRAITDNCISTVVVWSVQSYIAILISSLFCGLIVLKIMSPQYRSKLIRFSRQAVVSFNKGVPSFIFRIIDLKESNLVSCSVRAVLIRDHVTKEKEFIPFYNRSLSLSIEETTGSDLFLAWPVNVIHVIDSQSPLYGLTPKKLQDEYLEIIVILEGVVENTGKLMQVRTSYVSKEILWDASFCPMLAFNPTTNQNEMDLENFDEIQITIPQPFLPLSKRFLRRPAVAERRSRFRPRKESKRN